MHITHNITDSISGSNYGDDSPERQSAQMSKKITKGGLDQYGPEH